MMELDFKRIELITFDCYGTLIDWETGILRALKPVLEAHRVKADPARLLKLFADAEARLEEEDYQLYRNVLTGVMEEIARKLKFDLDADELDCLWQSVPDWKPFPDTVDALNRLAARYRLAVISNVDDDLFESTRKKLGVDFEWIITAEQAGAYKPSPDVFDYAMGMMGIPPEIWLHVAQSVYHDLIPAKGFEINTAWINRKSRHGGSGAVRVASIKPDAEFPDLKSLANSMLR